MFPPKDTSACKLPGESTDDWIIHAIAHNGHWIRIGMHVIQPKSYVKDKPTLQLIAK